MGETQRPRVMVPAGALILIVALAVAVVVSSPMTGLGETASRGRDVVRSAVDSTERDASSAEPTRAPALTETGTLVVQPVPWPARGYLGIEVRRAGYRFHRHTKKRGVADGPMRFVGLEAGHYTVSARTYTDQSRDPRLIYHIRDRKDVDPFGDDYSDRIEGSMGIITQGHLNLLEVEVTAGTETQVGLRHQTVPLEVFVVDEVGRPVPRPLIGLQRMGRWVDPALVIGREGDDVGRLMLNLPVGIDGDLVVSREPGPFTPTLPPLRGTMRYTPPGPGSVTITARVVEEVELVCRVPVGREWLGREGRAWMRLVGRNAAGIVYGGLYVVRDGTQLRLELAPAAWQATLTNARGDIRVARFGVPAPLGRLTLSFDP